MDLVDPKRIRAVTDHSLYPVSLPPPPPFSVKQNRGDWGEKGGLAACIKGVIVIIFVFCRRGTLGAGGCPKPRYLGNSSKTEIRPKNFPESSCCRNEDFRETRRCDVLEVCAQEHPAHIIKTLLKPPFSSGMNNRTSSAKLRCQVFADLELAYHVTLFE